MAATGWKTFRFWDATQIALPESESFSLEASATCITYGADRIIVGTGDGTIRLLDQSLRTVQQFRAHHSAPITHIKCLPKTSWIVTLAEDLSSDPELRVWALDQLDSKSALPKCLCTTPVQNGKRRFPTTAVAVLRNLTQVAVGFANGSVTIIRGDFIHDRGTKQRTVLDSNQPITGLEFWEGSVTVLFIATTAKISTLIIAGKGQGQPAHDRYDHGCALDCMTKNAASGDIYVARNDGVHTFTPRSPGPFYPYHGEKKLIRVVKDHVLLVSPPQGTHTSRTGPLRSFATTNADSLFSSTSLAILDRELKVVAHSEALATPINTIFGAWDSIFVLTQDGKLLRYREKTLEKKLELLYQRDSFVLAINMAQRVLMSQKDKLDPLVQNGIFRRYGDYLYQKGDYDTAMQQYLRAIDDTEPSQIIRKYLDNQRIRNLVEYLEELHEHHTATSDHTALLLNCYAKLKDVHKLEDFIKSRDELTCDLDTAISMCRQGGYSDQAAFLARKYNEHALVVEILIEDLAKYAESLAYIWRLEPPAAYANATQFGTVLLRHEPKDTTQFFIDYCTGAFRPKKDAVVTRELPASQAYEGYGITTKATTAVQNLAALIPLPYMSTDVPRSPSGEQQDVRQQVIETTVDDTFVEYKVPEPRDSFSSFIDHPVQFVVFLEACIDSDGILQEKKADLYTTLFELYLQQAADGSEAERADWTSKAKSLVEKHNVVMGPTNVLLVSHLSSFADGTRLVREQRKLYFDIFRAYTSAKDTAGAIQALRRYGPEEPKLYPAALTYLTSSGKILKEAGDELDLVLKRIDQDGLMAPLQIIQALSQSRIATMGLIKPYLSKIVEHERSETASNKRLVTSYRTDTEMKRQELHDLDTKATSFSASRCSLCGTPLDLPVVHFMCKHSFHQRCFSAAPGVEINADDDMECPKCAPQNETIKAIKRAQDESAERHDLFLDALGRTSDTFGTVSEWLGRGVMSAATFVE